MKPAGFEGCDPNFGICEDAVEVLAWQALATTELNQVRDLAILRADQIIGDCRRCVGGSLLLGDGSKVCKMAGLAIEFTSLGPDIDSPALCEGPAAEGRIGVS